MSWVDKGVPRPTGTSTFFPLFLPRGERINPKSNCGNPLVRVRKGGRARFSSAVVQKEGFYVLEVVVEKGTPQSGF